MTSSTQNARTLAKQPRIRVRTKQSHPSAEPQSARKRRRSIKHYERQSAKLAKRLAPARETFESLLRQADMTDEWIVSAFRAGEELQGALESYFDSFAVKFLAARDARRGGCRPVEADLLEVAGRLDVFARCDEQANLVVKPKVDGSERYILSYGIEQRARQIIVRDALEAMFDHLSPLQTGARGGPVLAIKYIQARYEQGYRHIAHLDVVECFSSFSVDKVAELTHLPYQVARFVVSAEHANIRITSLGRNVAEGQDTDTQSPHGGDTAEAAQEAVLRKARLGLSTGSKASPLLAELMLSLVFHAFADCADAEALSFVDNFILLARSQASLRDAERKLRDALHRHPAGPLREHKAKKLAPTEPFEFLGYTLKPDGKRIAVALSRANEEKAKAIRRDGYRRLKAARSHPESQTVFAECEQKHKDFIQAFGAWPGRHRMHRNKMEKMRQRMKTLSS